MDLKILFESITKNRVQSPDYEFSGSWDRNVFNSQIKNTRSKSIKLDEIVLFKILLNDLNINTDTPFYGECWQMWGQYEGTLDKPALLGLGDGDAYFGLPKKEGFFTVYNLLLLNPENRPHILFAFTSCRRFQNKIRFSKECIEIVVDMDGYILEPGQTAVLESFIYDENSSTKILFDTLANEICKNHPRLEFEQTPSGWCSWYCYERNITEQIVLDNMKIISENAPELKYIQIDDGYQSAWGDWLIENDKFPNGIKTLCEKIKSSGFEPAIWVAPFIVCEKSLLFREHPEWLVRDLNNNPRCLGVRNSGGNWYIIDGANPQVQQHFRKIFSVMHKEWGCTYFKLDFLSWSAIPGSRFYNNSTSVEAFRLGMKAIHESVGNSFILGCNAPWWPSLGTVHGNRTSCDVSFDKFQNEKRILREILHRNWQHRRLWINDPDCFCLAKRNNEFEEKYYDFRASVVAASGGMMLSGDNTELYTNETWRKIRKLLRLIDCPAEIEPGKLETGIANLPDGNKIIYLFNWDLSPRDLSVKLPGKFLLKDYWSGKEIGVYENEFTVVNMEPETARIILLERK